MLKIYNLLGLMQRAGKLITGEDLITKNLKNKKIKLLVIATFYGVNHIEFSDIENISRAIGRDNRVALGMTDDGFIKKFKQLLEEGGRL